MTVTNNGYVITSLDQFRSSHPYANSCTDFWLYINYVSDGNATCTEDGEEQLCAKRAARSSRPRCVMGIQGRTMLVWEKAKSSTVTFSANATSFRAEQP